MNLFYIRTGNLNLMTWNWTDLLWEVTLLATDYLYWKFCNILSRKRFTSGQELKHLGSFLQGSRDRGNMP
jgi:hypothetical protein